MGLFGNLFEKKVCSVCGGEIGLLGNRKLEDGNLCKNCANKLSPWFAERRHSTVAEIEQQLAYREDNRVKAQQFDVSRSIGEDWKVLFDEGHRWLTVTKARNIGEANPDIIDYSAVTGCRMDIDQIRHEIMRDGSDGKKVSYNPPRYDYSYDFKIIISVNNPYFDEMSFSMSDGYIWIKPYENMGAGMNPGANSAFGRIMSGLNTPVFDPMSYPEYQQYYTLTQEVCEEIRRIQALGVNAAAAYSAPGYVNADNTASQQAQYTPEPQYAQTAQAVNTNWFCPACGAQNSGKFCEYCGTPRP